MEIDLDVLQAMLQRASVTSNLDALAGHDFSLYADLYGSSLQISIQDSETLNTIITISIPVKARTTFSF